MSYYEQNYLGQSRLRMCFPPYASQWVRQFEKAFPKLGHRAGLILAKLNGCSTESELHEILERALLLPQRPMPRHQGLEVLAADRRALVLEHGIEPHAADLFLTLFPVGEPIDGEATSALTELDQTKCYLELTPENEDRVQDELKIVLQNFHRRYAAHTEIEDYFPPMSAFRLNALAGWRYTPYRDLEEIDDEINDEIMSVLGFIEDPDMGHVEVLASPRMYIPDMPTADEVTWAAIHGQTHDNNLRLVLTPRPMQYRTGSHTFTCVGFFQSGISTWPALMPPRGAPLDLVVTESRFYKQADPTLFDDSDTLFFDFIRHQIELENGDEEAKLSDDDYIELPTGWLIPREY